jgi:hypothetical protein
VLFLVQAVQTGYRRKLEIVRNMRAKAAGRAAPNH